MGEVVPGATLELLGRLQDVELVEERGDGQLIVHEWRRMRRKTSPALSGWLATVRSERGRRRDRGPEIRLDPGELEQLAELVAESLGRRSARLVTAREVAEHLSVDESYVYEHAAELGARRLGESERSSRL